MTKSITRMQIDDAEHYTPDERAAIIASYPEHEREARTKGIPSLGSGRIFPVSEDSITIDPVPIERHWARIIGIDFGYDHPFAAASLAWDRDADVIYVTAAYREAKTTPAIHVAAVRPWGDWIPVAWPHDGMSHDRGSGDQLAGQYRAGGLNCLSDHATHPEGGFGVEAGVMEMLERMQTGRLKVFRGLIEWFAEFRLYHRENGKIVKLRDDLLSATRYGVMMKRFADTERPAPRIGEHGSAGSWMG